MVCHPFFAFKRECRFNLYQKSVSGPSQSNKSNTNVVDYRRVFIYGFVSFVFSVLISIPLFFEYEIGVRNDNETTIYFAEWRRNKKGYIWAYSVAFELVIRYIAPVFVLFLTNLKIFLTVRKSGMSSPAAWTLFMVVIIFIVCQTWRCIVSITEALILINEMDTCMKNEQNPNIGVPYWLLILKVIQRLACLINRYVLFYSMYSKIDTKLKCIFSVRSIVWFTSDSTRVFDKPF